jgi:hypothetical protein
MILSESPRASVNFLDSCPVLICRSGPRAVRCSCRGAVVAKQARYRVTQPPPAFAPAGPALAPPQDVGNNLSITGRFEHDTYMPAFSYVFATMCDTLVGSLRRPMPLAIPACRALVAACRVVNCRSSVNAQAAVIIAIQCHEIADTARPVHA